MSNGTYQCGQCGDVADDAHPCDCCCMAGPGPRVNDAPPASIDVMTTQQLLNLREQLATDLTGIEVQLALDNLDADRRRSARAAKSRKRGARAAVQRLLDQRWREERQARAELGNARQKTNNQAFALAASRMLDAETYRRIWDAAIASLDEKEQ